PRRLLVPATEVRARLVGRRCILEAADVLERVAVVVEPPRVRGVLIGVRGEDAGVALELPLIVYGRLLELEAAGLLRHEELVARLRGVRFMRRPGEAPLRRQAEDALT